MSRPATEQREERMPAPAIRGEMAGETRIDPAHPVASALADATAAKPSDAPGEQLSERAFPDLGSAGPLTESFGVLPSSDGGGLDLETTPLTMEPVSRQVQHQAAQLAEHLRGRENELDRREAELNARAAQLERDASTARLWLSERMAELDETPKPSEAEVAQREESLRRTAATLAQRSRELDATEMRLDAQQAEITTLHEQVIADGRRQEEETRNQRLRLDKAHAEQTVALEEKRRDLERRAVQLDQSQAALVQLRGELDHMHRETLEIRLATEELWAELSGEVPPATLTRSLGRIRGQLAEHYRLANAELHSQKMELDGLRENLAQQHEKLIRQKSQFDAWVASCREEVERQSARLVGRSDELDQEAARLREQSRIWQAQRLANEQELRRLRRRLTAGAEAAAPIAP